MTKIDDILQDHLDALEAGEPLDKVLSELTEETAELEPILRMASALKKVPHPRPLPARQFDGSSLGMYRNGQKQRSQAGHVFTWPRLALAFGVSGAAMLLVVAFFTIVAAGIWLAGPQTARAARLIDVTGSVEIATNGVSNGWQLAQEGQSVHKGDQVRTGADGSVSLLFYEGSRTMLTSNTDLTITNLGGGWGKVLKVLLTQDSGRTVNSVVPFRGRKSSYQVLTPSGIASVHGTEFKVDVAQNGTSRFSVDTGEVKISSESSELTLTAGQTAAAQLGQLPDQPDYQFSLEGILSGGEDGIWSINGVSFSIDPEATVTGDPQSNDYVHVEGHFLEDGSRVADSIEVVESGEPQSSFSGELEGIVNQTWTINGNQVTVDENTEIEGQPAIGDTVKVTFIVQSDGSWLAIKIESLEEEEPPVDTTPSPEVTETISPTVTMSPTLTITPSISPTLTATPEITSTVAVTATQFVNCTGANPQPKGAQLATKYNVPYEEIMGWFCQHYGFGEIDRAYEWSNQYNIPVEEIFALRASGLGWGEIKKILPSYATTTPEPGQTEEPLQVTPVPPQNSKNPCQGGPADRRGQMLAARLGVSYDEIMSWYCQGYAYNDISKAYEYSRSYGTSVGEILNMHASGMAWGQIKQQLEGQGSPGGGKKNKP